MYHRLIRRELFCCLFKDCPNFFQRFISLTFICYCLLRTNRTKSKPPHRPLNIIIMNTSSAVVGDYSEQGRWHAVASAHRRQHRRRGVSVLSGRLRGSSLDSSCHVTWSCRYRVSCTRKRSVPRQVPRVYTPLSSHSSFSVFYGSFGSLLVAGELVVVSTKRPTPRRQSCNMIMKKKSYPPLLAALLSGKFVEWHLSKNDSHIPYFVKMFEYVLPYAIIHHLSTHCNMFHDMVVKSK